MDTIVWVVVLGTSFSVVAYLLRVLPPKTGAAFFLLAPTFLVIYWQFRPPDDLTLFSYVKLYSVCVGALYVQALKFTNLVNRLWGRRLGYLVRSRRRSDLFQLQECWKIVRRHAPRDVFAVRFHAGEDGKVDDFPRQVQSPDPLSRLQMVVEPSRHRR